MRNIYKIATKEQDLRHTKYTDCLHQDIDLVLLQLNTKSLRERTHYDLSCGMEKVKIDSKHIEAICQREIILSIKVLKEKCLISA